MVTKVHTHLNKPQLPYHIATSQLIYNANQLTGFYMMGKLQECLSTYDLLLPPGIKWLNLHRFQILHKYLNPLSANPLLTSNSHRRVNSFSTLDQVSKILTFFNDITETNDKYKDVFTSSKITHVD